MLIAMSGHPPFEGTFESIDWSNWEPVDRATLLFIMKDDEMLLIHKKRGLGAGKINAPGGRIDPGETPEQAAVREVQEELLVTPHEPAYAGELAFQFKDGYSIHATVFTSTRFSGNPTETEEAIPMWIHRECIPYDKMWADDRLWLPLLLKDQLFSGRFLFDEEVMLGHDLKRRS